MTDIINKIEKLKKEKNAVILAHYYTNDDIQQIADYVGDSYYLSKLATTLDAETLVFCGVYFMGESAKVLNPEKKVLMPDLTANCPMAHMAYPEKIRLMREKYDDLAVVCYINSTAEIKACSDVCVTSSNAQKIVEALTEKNIYFIPDENLGRCIAKNISGKNFIFNDGYCPVHVELTAELIKNAKQLHPDAKVLIHPECKEDAVALSDFCGSTAEIIDYATESNDKEFIVCTEIGVLYELKKKNPDKTFYTAHKNPICPDMKKITLEKVLKCLETGSGEMIVDQKIVDGSNAPLNRMLELAK